MTMLKKAIDATRTTALIATKVAKLAIVVVAVVGGALTLMAIFFLSL